MAPLKRKDRVRGVYERDKGSGVWWIRFTDQDGVRRREKVGPRSLAITALKVRHAQVIESRYVPGNVKQQRLADAIKAHLKRQRQRKVKTMRDQERYGKLWTAELGTRQLRSIRTAEIESILDRRREDVSDQTVVHEAGFLRRVFNVAVRDGRADRNPVPRIRRPKNSRVRYLTEQEEVRLLEKLPERWHPHVLVALHTGMRQGEQLGLRWRDVDLKAGLIRLDETKTGEPRFVALNATAAAALRSLPRSLRTPWVFVGSTGRRRINARWFARKVWSKAVVEAEIEDFTWHDLRHTFASRLTMAGVDLRTVAALLGHRSIQMTMRYAHLAPGHMAKAVTVLNGHKKSKRTATRTATVKSDD